MVIEQLVTQRRLVQIHGNPPEQREIPLDPIVLARDGRELGNLAVTIGRPELVTLDEVEDSAWIATAAAIGAPGGLTDWQMLGMDYVTAARLLQDALGAPLYGLMIGQNGM